MLTIVRFVLQLAPANAALEQTTNAIFNFLGPPPNLLFREACEFGSVTLLEWIWSASCTTAADRTPSWTLNNFLRSDPHYHKWQFSNSLKVAVDRGDLPVVEWLFTHFSGCEAPGNVAHLAQCKGYLRVLRFLMEHESESGCQEANRQKGMRRDCWVRSGTFTRFLPADTVKKACENGQLVQCLDEGMGLYGRDIATAIAHALSINNVELAEWLLSLLPGGGCILDYADSYSRAEVVEKIMGCGYLRLDNGRAASMLSASARCGRLDLVQSVVQLYSPQCSDRQRWVKRWMSAVKMASRNGHLPVLRWLVAQPLWREGLERGEFIHEIPHLFPEAAEQGHAEVMDFLYSNELINRFYVGSSMKAAVNNGHASSVKWLLDHDLLVERELWVDTIRTSIENGYLEILKLFHELDASRSQGRQTDSWWQYVHRPMYPAAKCGRLDILEWLQVNCVQLQWETEIMDIAAGEGHLNVVKWLHHNRPEGCTKDAMDSAAANGHLEVVQWLHTNRSEGCSDRAMRHAAQNGHLEMVRWLYANIPESRTPVAIDAAVSHGRFRVVCWLQPRFPGHRIGGSVLVQNFTDSFETLLFLQEHHDYVFTPDFLKGLRQEFNHFSQVTPWLNEHYTNC